MDGVGAQLINLFHRIGKETKMRSKVSEIEFHITFEEAEDCILRAAELIKEGYKLYSYKYDTPKLTCHRKTEPFLHIIFKRSHHE